MFDSVSEPLIAGMRAGSCSPRLLLYAKAGRLLKLRVESLGGSESLSLLGQLVDEASPQRTISDVPVLVQAGRKTVSETLTNQAGEFAIHLSPAESLRLVIALPGSETMMVMLPVAIAVEEDG